MFGVLSPMSRVTRLLPHISVGLQEPWPGGSLHLWVVPELLTSPKRV